jgi:phytol kinase
MNPWLGMSIVAGSFIMLMGGLKLACRRWEIRPEASRKLVHIGMGIVTLIFPWLFASVWPVWVLSGSFVVILAAIRCLPPLQRRFGSILGGIERKSWGEFFFPVAVAIVFTLADHQRAHYVIPILVLTLGDAVAALVGVRFGRTKYQTEEGSKSIEGSVALFAVTALSVGLPAMLMLDHAPFHAAVLGMCVAVLAALVEAISWRGLDNLFLPVVTFVMLLRFQGRTEAELLLNLFVAVGLFVVLLLWRRQTTLRDDALATATLVLYVCWIVGGWLWLVSPLTLALAYTFLPFHPQRLSRDVHGNWIVLSLGAAGLVWLFLDGGVKGMDFRVPYVLSFAAQLSMVFLARWRRGKPDCALATIILGGAFAAWIMVFGPALLLGLARWTVAAAVAAFLVILIVMSLLGVIVKELKDMPNTPRRWIIQTTLAFVASSAGLLPVFNR